MRATENRRYVAIVQARLGSSRLPLKALLCLKGLPVIDWVMGRLARSARLCEVVAAIPDTRLDMALAEHLRRSGRKYVAGSENDVLGRFAMAAAWARADVVIRICADNPLVSWEAIDQLIGFYEAGEYDYAWNHVPRNNLWPDGLGGEIVSADLLRYLARQANLPSQREHCLNYIWDNPDRFKMATFDPGDAWLARPQLKLDLDTVEDFCRLSSLPLAPGQNLRELMAALAQAGRESS